MNNRIHENLIETIREHLPEGNNLTNYLSATLNIGRESAYRRIRGEINFTFEEIAVLSRELGFSVDNIIGIKKNENALFNIHMLQKMDYVDIYVNKMNEYARLFRETSQQMETKARISINTLPYFFHINYEALSKFRIYKWLYQNQKVSPTERYADFILPEKVLNAHKRLYQDIQMVKNVTIIMDNDVFWSMAKEIEYFYKRGLLVDEDLESLKTELLEMVNVLEEWATKGVNKNGAKIYMYISAVDLEASYLHYEYGAGQFSQVKIFSISAIDSFDIDLCKIQKEWIESLKRYSVLISESGEMQRFDYMNRQRDYISKLNTVEIHSSKNRFE